MAVAHSRLQMVQRAAKARQRRQRKEKADEARRNKDKAKAQREEEQAQKAERRVRRDQEERKRRPVGHCRPQVEHDRRRGGILEGKWTQGEGRMRTTERAQEGRGVGWLCDWRGANRVVDMKAKGVQFEAVRRAVMGGYLKWEDDSTGGGGGESEVATGEAQGREGAQEGTPESQQIVAVGVEQGRDGDLARVYIECSGKGFPAGRTEGVQSCGSQHHGTVRAAELCAKAVREGQECRWGGMLEKGGGRWNARGVTPAEPQKGRGRRARVHTHRLGTGAQPHRLEGGEQADGMAVGGGRQGGIPQGTVGRRGRQQVKPPEHPTRRETRQGNLNMARVGKSSWD